MINFTCIHYINGEISLVKNGRGPQVAMDAKICACCSGRLEKRETGIRNPEQEREQEQEPEPEQEPEWEEKPI